MTFAICRSWIASASVTWEGYRAKTSTEFTFSLKNGFPSARYRPSDSMRTCAEKTERESGSVGPGLRPMVAEGDGSLIVAVVPDGVSRVVFTFGARRLNMTGRENLASTGHRRPRCPRRDLARRTGT